MVQVPELEHHDDFQKRTSAQIIDLLFPQVAEGTVEVIFVGASRTHSVVQRKRCFCSEPSQLSTGSVVAGEMARQIMQHLLALRVCGAEVSSVGHLTNSEADDVKVTLDHFLSCVCLFNGQRKSRGGRVVPCWVLVCLT